MINETETLKRVTSIFQDIFDDSKLVIQRETTAKDIDEWDSLMHINLVVAIEKDFSIKFALAELSGLKNVGEMLDLIQKKVNK